MIQVVVQRGERSQIAKRVCKSVRRTPSRDNLGVRTVLQNDAALSAIALVVGAPTY